VEVVIFQLIGIILFIICTIYLGIKIKKESTIEEAVKLSRISHFFYWFGLVLPGFIAVFYPGLQNIDKILGFYGFTHLKYLRFFGIVPLYIGIYFSLASIQSLRKLGSGTAAFKLTKNVVSGNVYQITRNPMSFGYYMFCIGLGLVLGSTTVTLGSLILIVPSHVFNLKFFEEKELQIRLGKSYIDYKENTPFLIPKFPIKKF